jgi:hypothetical protein
MTRPAVADGLSSALRAGSSATFIYTMATIQASFANAAEFFNSLLVLLSQKVAGDCHWESVIEGDSHFSI